MKQIPGAPFGHFGSCFTVSALHKASNSHIELICLVIAPFYGKCASAMTRWSRRHVLTILLGVFVALGMNLSAVQASDMAIKMTNMSSSIAMADHGNCDGCGGGNDIDAKGTTSCVSICVTPVVGLLPAKGSARVFVLTAFQSPESPALFSRASPPEPYPPRPQQHRLTLL